MHFSNIDGRFLIEGRKETISVSVSPPVPHFSSRLRGCRTQHTFPAPANLVPNLHSPSRRRLLWTLLPRRPLLYGISTDGGPCTQSRLLRSHQTFDPYRRGEPCFYVPVATSVGLRRHDQGTCTCSQSSTALLAWDVTLLFQAHLQASSFDCTILARACAQRSFRAFMQRSKMIEQHFASPRSGRPGQAWVRLLWRRDIDHRGPSASYKYDNSLRWLHGDKRRLCARNSARPLP